MLVDDKWGILEVKLGGETRNNNDSELTVCKDLFRRETRGDRLIDVERARRDVPLLEKRIYLNHAAISPCIRPVREAIEKHLEDWTWMNEEFMRRVPFGGEGWEQGETRDVKASFAKLIGAKVEQIALTHSTFVGLSAVVNALEYPRGCNVVVMDPRLEHPSYLPNWLRERGIEVRYVYASENGLGKIPLSEVEKKVDDKTVFVFASYIEYPNGLRNDVKGMAEIAHDHGAKIVVDAFQAVGHIDVNVRELDVDFLATGTYKYLMGPKGTGFLYVKDYDDLKPVLFGWACGPWYREFDKAKEGYVMGLHNSAARFEVGSYSIIGFIGAKAAIDYFLKLGMKNVEERLMYLGDYLIERLQEIGLKINSPLDPECRSGSVNFRVKGDPWEVAQKLRAARLWVTGGDHYAHGIRVSPHFYNTEEDIDRFIKELKKYV